MFGTHIRWCWLQVVLLVLHIVVVFGAEESHEDMHELLTKHYEVKSGFLQAQKENFHLKRRFQDPYTHQSHRPLTSSCAEALKHDKRSGVYQIFLPTSELKPFFVYCMEDPDNQTAWTVIQRRLDNTTNFDREWNDYKVGFGNLEGNYFLGLDKIHALTHSQVHQMWARYSESIYNETRDAHDEKFESFIVGDESTKYAIMSLGPTIIKGNVDIYKKKDYLRPMQGKKFSASDSDNDGNEYYNCAEREKAGWWFDDCRRHEYEEYPVNLNGVFKKDRRHSFPYTHMAIRPVI